MQKIYTLVLYSFLVLFINKAYCFITNDCHESNNSHGDNYGFLEQYRNLVFYNLSKYNVTEENCNDILDQAKNYKLFCVNNTELSQNVNKRPKSYYQNYLEKFFIQNKEEIGVLSSRFISSYKIFRDLSNHFLSQAFSSWTSDFKKFITKHQETIDNFVLSLINDVFGLFDESFRKNPDTADYVILNKVIHLTQYSTYEPDHCMEKFNSMKNHTCFIFSKNYYTLRYNYFMNRFLLQ